MISHKRRVSAAALLLPLVVAFVVRTRAASAGGAGAPSAPSGEQQFTRLLDRARQMRDFRAGFTQRLSSRGLADPALERGRVFYLRPGRMRWEYAEPETKLAISDGRTGWLYLPEESRVIRMDLGHSITSGPLADLLAGDGAALPAFRATALPVREGLAGVRLTPVTPQEEFQEIEVRVEEKSFRIVSVEFTDPGGNRMAFEFTGMAENTGLAPALFTFQPPAGTRVEEP